MSAMISPHPLYSAGSEQYSFVGKWGSKGVGHGMFSQPTKDQGIRPHPPARAARHGGRGELSNVQETGCARGLGVQTAASYDEILTT